MNDTHMNYYYVLITPIINDVIIRFNDLKTTEYTKYIHHTPLAPKNSFMDFLYRLHTSKKTNAIINMPFKNIWKKKISFPKIMNTSGDSESLLPFCFVIYARYFQGLTEYRTAFLEYLRKEYENCKIILYLSDLSKNHSNFDPIAYRQYFDAIYTFDKNDANDNNFNYFGEQPFSSYPVKKNVFLPRSDVLFVGQAKNRFVEIIKIFELMRENDLICDFHIIGVSNSERMYKDKINYHKYPIPYYKVLQHVIASKCILEILQDGGTSHTARVSEAIFYGKRILSNCHELKSKPYYNPEYISLFSSLQDIDINFLKNINKRTEFIDYKYKQNLSPLWLIENIEQHLNGKQ